MIGRVKYRADRGYWYVQFGDYKISRYKGFLCRDGEISGMRGEQMAIKLLAVLQSDFEQNPKTFRIEKYTEQKVDTIPFMREWLKAVSGTLSPATFKDYQNSIENHLIPWFRQNPYDLHEIRYDTLCSLLSGINRNGKGKLNVMYCLRSCMDYAWKSERILAVPPFPERRLYGLQKKKIVWLPEDRQIKIIEAVPIEHQPIIWWLKFHLRRPSEACALYKVDYSKERDSFIIRRTFSNRQLVEYTKTHAEHEIPCHPNFKPILQRMPKTFGSFFFENQSRDCKTKKTGRHYTVVGLENIWNTACEKVGENINLYQGTKHSSCSQFINELGGTIDELQMLTDHARRDSVLKYADAELERKRQLMAKVIPFTEPRLNRDENKNGK